MFSHVYTGNIHYYHNCVLYYILICLCCVAKPIKYHYENALSKSILFYDAQRSGVLPADNPISWRSDSAVNDRSDSGMDLSGGWYDGMETPYLQYMYIYIMTNVHFMKENVVVRLENCFVSLRTSYCLFFHIMLILFSEATSML